MSRWSFGFWPSSDWQAPEAGDAIGELKFGELEFPDHLLPHARLFAAIVLRAIHDTGISPEQLGRTGWRGRKRTKQYGRAAAAIRAEAAEWLRSDSYELYSFRWWAAGLGLDGPRLQQAVLREMSARRAA